MSQEELRDIAGDQLANTNPGASEALDQETSDRAPIPNDRLGRKTALLLEVALIPLAKRRQRGVIKGRLWRRNGPFLAQVLQEMRNGSGVSSPEFALAPSFRQEMVGDLLIQVHES
jgi:hypothetical protein